MDPGHAAGRSPVCPELAVPVPQGGTGVVLHVDPPDAERLALHRLRAGPREVHHVGVGVAHAIDPRPRGGRGRGLGSGRVSRPEPPVDPLEGQEAEEEGEEEGDDEEEDPSPAATGAAEVRVGVAGIVVAGRGGHGLILSYGAQRLPGALAVGGALEQNVPWPPGFCARVSLPVFDRENPAQKPAGC